MRHFQITSPKFQGIAMITYNKSGTICCIDLREAAMDEFTSQRFINSVAGNVENIAQKFVGETVVVEVDFDLTFEMFWQEYPLHRNRYKAEKIWSKCIKTDQVMAYNSLRGYKRYLKKNSWQTAMMADRFLRDREFETDWNKI